MAGRTVKIYLKEGTPNSLLIAEFFNWTGKVFVIPRSQLVQVADRPEVKQTGIYVLVGQDLDEPTKDWQEARIVVVDELHVFEQSDN